MPKFSIVLTVKNEEETLPVLFSSLGEFMKRGGDLVIVDTGSTDATIKVSEDFGARVVAAGDAFLITITPEESREINRLFVEPNELSVIEAGTKLFDYGRARNFAHEHAANDMILIVGGDGYFAKLDLDAIDDAISGGTERFEVDLLERVGNRFYSDQRLYDRRYFHWEGTMHEHLMASFEMNTSRFRRLSPEIIAMEHRPLPNENRSKYLANLAYACWVDPTNERQAHCFARQLMYEGRYRSAVAGFMRHILMRGETWN